MTLQSLKTLIGMLVEAHLSTPKFHRNARPSLKSEKQAVSWLRALFASAGQRELSQAPSNILSAAVAEILRRYEKDIPHFRGRLDDDAIWVENRGDYAFEPIERVAQQYAAIDAKWGSRVDPFEIAMDVVDHLDDSFGDTA